MMRQMQLPFTQEDALAIMVHSLWACTKGTPAERRRQVADAVRMTAHANPKIKGERLFLLTLEWLKTSTVVVA